MPGVLTHKQQHVPTSFFLAVVITLAVVAILVAVLPSITAPIPVTGMEGDRSYDGIEQLRVLHSTAYTVELPGYDHVEALRTQRNATSFSTYDGYAGIEQFRANRADTADRSYDSLENIRLGR